MAQSSHQDSIARHEVDILQERTAKFLGKARVLLDSLQFPKQVLVDLQRHNVDRLKRVFELEGCRRLEPDRHIPALIDAKDLQSALEYTATDHVTSETLLDNPDALPPLLKLPSHLSIECLRGKHRVTAAKETSVLEATDRWWIVDLYSADLGAEGQRELVEQYCNSHNFTDGSVYIRILRYRDSRQELAEKQWWARLTKSKRNILKRFLRHPKLASGFAKLCKFEALLVHGFRIGTLLEIMSSRLDEEILCYLNHISAIWSAIIGGDSEHRHALDSQTVASLQSKAPGVYSSEYSALRQDIEQGTIFSLLKRSKNQAKILQNLITIMYPIPTLVTLRKDLRYLDACARAVRQAVLGPMAQLQSSFSEAVQKYFTNVNQKDGYFCLQLRDSSVIYCKSSASYGPFETGYRQLHLYAMRNILHLNSSLPRQHRRCAKQRRKQDPFAWVAFGELAFQLGFDSEEIQRLRARNFQRELVAAMLPSSQYENLEPVIDDILQRLRSAKRKAPSPVEEISTNAHDSVEDLTLRCGWITETDYEATRQHLYLNILASDVPAPQRAISSLQVRKRVYELFFGTLDVAPCFSHEAQDDSAIGAVSIAQSVYVPNKRRKLSSGLAQSASLPDSQVPPAPELVGGQRDTISQSIGLAARNDQESTLDPKSRSFVNGAQQGRFLPRKAHATSQRTVEVCLFNNSKWNRKRSELGRSELEAFVTTLLYSDGDMHLYDADGYGLTVGNCFDSASRHSDKTLYVVSRSLDRHLLPRYHVIDENEEL